MDNEEQIHTHSSSDVKFVCPNDGEIPQEDVIFLCNKCKQADLIYQDGIYMCPSCLNPGENFQCVRCESTDVKMIHKKEKD